MSYEATTQEREKVGPPYPQLRSMEFELRLERARLNLRATKR